MRGFAMSSYEWMELQTLTSDIAASRARLVAARSSKDNRLARVLEQEIGEAERRRDLLLSNITDQVAGHGEPSSSPEPAAAEAPLTLEPAATVAAEEETPEQPVPLPEPAAAEVVVSHPAAPSAARTEGGSAVWDQLTPGDIENAKHELAGRRAEMLARHAEELKAVETDQAQLDTLAEAIELFARKFKVAAQSEAPNAAVVTLDEERELRMQSRA
jgi:hypothetical protein